MTPTTLFILAATCSLAVPVALFLVLWRRDTRRLAADNQASEARERDATSRLAAAEARLAAAEQALSAEKELRQRYEGQVQALTEQRTRTEAELAALRASSEAEIASLRAKNAEDRAADEVLEGLTDKERECLLKLTGKVIENCKAMGVDYRTIAVKGCRARKPSYHHGHGCCRR